MLWKCCTSYTSKFGKFSSGHRTGKGQFSFQSQRKAIPKKVQTTTQLHSSHTLMLKILQARLQQYMNHELPDVEAGFRKGRGTRNQTANICWIIKKSKSFSKTSTSALLTMPKLLTVDHNKLQRRQWQPTPVLLPEKSYGQRSLVGCSPWGR